MSCGAHDQPVMWQTHITSISHLKRNAVLRLLDDEAEEQDKSSSQGDTDSEESGSGDTSDESDPFVDSPKPRWVIFDSHLRC